MVGRRVNAIRDGRLFAAGVPKQQAEDCGYLGMGDDNGADSRHPRLRDLQHLQAANDSKSGKPCGAGLQSGECQLALLHGIPLRLNRRPSACYLGVHAHDDRRSGFWFDALLPAGLVGLEKRNCAEH